MMLSTLFTMNYFAMEGFDHSWQMETAFFALTIYVLYYLLLVVRRPMLACAEGPYKEYLLRNVPILMENYWPTFWCIEGRIQTVVAVLLRKHVGPHEIEYSREIFTLSDKGIVALDWLDGCTDDAPCIIILPGLTGHSQTEYVKYLASCANKAGFRVVVFNNRGLGGVNLNTPRLYCASNCDDISEVILHVRHILPGIKLAAVGISMGGLILGNYLVRKSEEACSLLTAAKIISVPWNVFKGTESVEKPFINCLLGRHLAKSLCRNLMQQAEIQKEILEQLNIDFQRIQTAKTVREFDALFTSKHFGYAHVNDYYTDASLHDKIHRINVPVLCVSAADDPFQPLEGIPIELANECSNVAIVVTNRGGHIGFLEGLWPSSGDQYLGRLLIEFFKKALHDETGEFEAMRRGLQSQIKDTKIKLLPEPTST